MRNKFLFKRKWAEKIEELPDKEFAEAMTAICEYFFEDRKIEFKSKRVKQIVEDIYPELDKQKGAR